MIGGGANGVVVGWCEDRPAIDYRGLLVVIMCKMVAWKAVGFGEETGEIDKYKHTLRWSTALHGVLTGYAIPPARLRQ